MPAEPVALLIVLVLAGAVPYLMLRSKVRDPKWQLYQGLFEALERGEPDAPAKTPAAHERKLV